MCGILAIASFEGPVRLSDAAIAAMRDRMSHRGPDGAGLWRGGSVALGHRRLAVIDPTGASAQPMRIGEGVLAYNGELYNEPEIRTSLEREGEVFSTRGDTETVLRAIARWGRDALGRFRGMFALAYHDVAAGTLLLARDPLGIKPLYHARVGVDIVAASEVPAILAHPGAAARPDIVGVSAYLSTIRTVLGERTMFAGISSLRPGESIEFNLREGTSSRREHAIDAAGEAPEGHALRAIVEGSIRCHLRSDVPLCSLLSGGLDSTVIAVVASASVPALRTYCAGAEEGGPDFEFAARVAAGLGASHREARVSRAMFGERWRDMVARQGVPLSTPNEVAINEVARVMRARGEVVTLSGEGADELFGGYAAPLGAAARFHDGRPREGEVAYELGPGAWLSAEVKAGALRRVIWQGLEGDAWLRGALGDVIGDARGMEAHLRIHRRVNLPGLLQRLDSATMLESIEGRTPFADRLVAAAAVAHPIRALIDLSRPEDAWASKLPLRRAFAGEVPGEVMSRPKASFPLPFEAWCADLAPALGRSGLIEELFEPMLIAAIAADPTRHWRLAWPMINLALWGDRWWG